MDFDNVINIVILVLFFVLPAVLNRFKKKKTANKALAKAEKPKTGKKKPLVFGNISDQIQKFLKDLEQQARQQEQTGDKTVWDELAREPGNDDEGFPEEPAWQSEDSAGPPVQKAPEPRKRKPAPYMAAESERQAPRKHHRSRSRPAPPPPLADCGAPARNRACRLRRAVVWAEILGKPVALK